MDQDPVIEQLDRAVRPSDVSAQIAATLERVVTKLESGNDVMAWDTIPLAVFGNALPPSIASCWIFVIRADAASTAERHPNSHQRSLSLVGEGEFQLRPMRPVGTSPPDECTRRVSRAPMGIHPSQHVASRGRRAGALGNGVVSYGPIGRLDRGETG